ncbi:MAG: acyl-CoA dehydrogenase family protein [Deltaproteobacteria bacterium]|nr:acyl-CoA dehydrogenase family protein [Deltaproteobacteria bacterium]
MIDFAPSKEQKMVKDSFAQVVRDLVTPAITDMEESGEIPGSAIQKTWELGASISFVPEAYGGDGMEYSPVMNAIILEELAAGDMSFAVAATVPSLFIIPVLDMGTEKQKEKYLPPVCTDEFNVSTVAVTEPRMGFDAMNLATKAEKKGGSYVLNGEKCFVPMAASAKHILVAAELDGAPRLFVVDAKNPGLSIGEREKNLGLYSLETNTVTLKDCEVPEDDLLPEENGGYKKFLQKGRVGLCALATGISRSSYEFARQYARERVQFGERIGQRQAVAFMVAEMAYETDAMRLLTWKAASKLENGKDAMRESTLARLYCGEMAMKVCDYGVQVMGGHGYIRDYPMERNYRNARGVAVMEGLATV